MALSPDLLREAGDGQELRLSIVIYWLRFNVTTQSRQCVGRYSVLGSFTNISKVLINIRQKPQQDQLYGSESYQIHFPPSDNTHLSSHSHRRLHTESQIHRSFLSSSLQSRISIEMYRSHWIVAQAQLACKLLCLLTHYHTPRYSILGAGVSTLSFTTMDPLFLWFF